jgi:hypothetical protein
MQRLTNETIKAMHLKKQLEERPTSNQIEIMELDNSNFNKLEIINRQVFDLSALKVIKKRFLLLNLFFRLDFFIRICSEALVK